MDGNNGDIIKSVQKSLDLISSEETVINFSENALNFDNEQYVNVDNDELADLLNISVSKIPTIITSATSIASSEQVRKVTEDGVFKIVFKNGVNDKSISDLCKNSEGLFITTYRDSNGFNQAGLSSIEQEISNKMNTIKAANVVNGVMSVASMVVGCYYMHNIDNKLNDINKKLDKIIDIFNDERIAKIKAVHELLLEITRKYNAGYLNKLQLESYHNEVVRSVREVKSIVNYYESRLTKTVNDIIRINSSSAEKDFKECFKDFQRDMNCYQYAVNIYTMAVTVEVIVSGNLSGEYIDSQINDINEYSNKCERNMKQWFDNISNWLVKTKTFDSKWYEKVVSYLPYAVPMVLLPLPSIGSFASFTMFGAAEAAHKNINDVFNEKNIKKRQEVYRSISDMGGDVFKYSAKALQNYSNRIQIIQHENIGLCYYKNKVYIDKAYLNDNDKAMPGLNGFVML